MLQWGGQRNVSPQAPVSGRDDQRPSRAFTGGLHANVRRRNLPMDARSTSRFARCNVDRECHRSIEVVPRYAPVPLGQYCCVNVRALYGLRGSVWERHRTLALLMLNGVVG